MVLMEGFILETNNVASVKSNENIPHDEMLYNGSDTWKKANAQADILLAKLSVDNFPERKESIKKIMFELTEEGNQNRFIVEVLARRLSLEESDYDNKQLVNSFE